MNDIIINEALARKVIEVVSAGLCSGVGNPIPGQMCVEAAVNYACGLPHGDQPICVGGAVRRFKIELNDASWSSSAARAEGMKAIAIAQLGSNTLSQIDFAERMAIKNTQIVLPALLTSLNMPEASERCKSVTDLSSVISAAESAKYAAESAESAESAKYAKYAVSAAEYAAKYAVSAAEYAAKSAAKSAKYAGEYAAEYAKYAVSAAEYAAKSAAKSAKYAAEYAAEYAKYAAESDPDFYFKLSARVCLEVLIEMKSPGCKFLYLIEK